MTSSKFTDRRTKAKWPRNFLSSASILNSSLETFSYDPNPILCAAFLFRIYRRPLRSRLRSRLSLAQLDDYIFGSQFAVLYLFHNRSERKAQLWIRIH
jgi:hypothetical protein